MTRPSTVKVGRTITTSILVEPTVVRAVPPSTSSSGVPDVLVRRLTTPVARALLDLVACLLVTLVALAAVAHLGVSPLRDLVALTCWTLLLFSAGHYRACALGETRGAGSLRVIRTGVTALLLAAAVAPLLPGGADAAALPWLAVAFTTASLVVLALPFRQRPRLVLAGHPTQVREALADLSLHSRHDVVAVCLTRRSDTEFAGIPTYVGLSQACVAATREDAHALVLLAGHQAPPVTLRRLQWDAAHVGTELYLGTGLLDVKPQRTRAVSTPGLDVLHVTHAALGGPRRLLKDVVERMLALGGLVMALPLVVVLSVLIRLESPGPALFRQKRIGRNGVPFTMFKLRSMAAGAQAEQSGLTVSNELDGVLFKIRLDPRITPLGQRLRRYSLDELPQLWNVVRGDMSLVGPRPALPDEVAAYDTDPRRRLVVKPGVTGLWQVSGRSDLSWSESIRLDLSYVENWSLGLDLRILARTITAVVGHRGAY